MLVDDEEQAIRSILKRIQWDEIGYEVPFLAHNGLEALEVAENNPIDVVMTDIEMPYMGGLELARNLKELYPNIRIIIFSGYDDFDYAREAIRLEVEEYILKPVNADELKEVFLRIKKNLEEELDAKQNVAKLQNYYMESLPLLQESFYASLMEGNMNEEECDRYIEDYKIPLHGPLYCVGVIHTGKQNNQQDVNQLLLAVSVRRLLEEETNPDWDEQFFTYLGNTVVISQFKSRIDAMQMTDYYDKFSRLAKSVCNADVTVGVGGVVTRVKDLPISFRGGRNALSYRAIYGTGKAINIEEIAPLEKEEISLSGEEVLHDIFQKIKVDEKDSLVQTVDKFVQEYILVEQNVQAYAYYVNALCSELYRFAINHNLDTRTVFGTNDDIYRLASGMDQIQLRRWVLEVTTSMQNMIQATRVDTNKSFVSKAIDYVYENYANKDLTVENLCKELGVSAAYFSTVFKRETGQTFVAFLTDVRMKKAIELLLEENEKTGVIARRVGYGDPNYFSYVFKKQFGISPSKYRDQHKGE